MLVIYTTLLLIATLLLSYIISSNMVYRKRVLVVAGIDEGQDMNELMGELFIATQSWMVRTDLIRRAFIERLTDVNKQELYYLNEPVVDDQNVHDVNIIIPTVAKWKRILKIANKDKKRICIEDIKNAYEKPATKRILDAIKEKYSKEVVQHLEATPVHVILKVWKAMNVLELDLHRSFELALESCTTNSKLEGLVCSVGVVSRIIDVFTHTEKDPVLSAPIADPTAIKSEAFIKSYSILQKHLSENPEVAEWYNETTLSEYQQGEVNKLKTNVAKEIAEKIYADYNEFVGEEQNRRLMYDCLMGVSDEQEWVNEVTDIITEVYA